jgi:hypothetical protein
MQDRIARSVFDYMVHCCSTSLTASGGESSEVAGDDDTEDILQLTHIQAVIERIQKDYKRSLKGQGQGHAGTGGGDAKKLQKNVITGALDSYELADRVWGLLDTQDVSNPVETIMIMLVLLVNVNVNVESSDCMHFTELLLISLLIYFLSHNTSSQHGAVDIKNYISVVLPVLEDRGGSVANTLISASVVRDFESSAATAGNGKQADITLLFQFIMYANLLCYFSHITRN